MLPLSQVVHSHDLSTEKTITDYMSESLFSTMNQQNHHFERPHHCRNAEAILLSSHHLITPYQLDYLGHLWGRLTFKQFPYSSLLVLLSPQYTCLQYNISSNHTYNYQEHDTVNSEIFVGDSFSWASIPKKIKPMKICTHEELATALTVGCSYQQKVIPAKI